MLPAVLVIGLDKDDRDAICEALRPLSCVVTAADTFDEGRALLTRLEPMVVVAPLQLREYNAIHLALIARVESPHTQVIIRGYPDPALGREAADAGATYLVDPRVSDIVAAVRDALARSTRRWPRAVVSVDAIVDEQPVRLVDVSYGGFRVEMPASTPIDRHAPIDLALGALRVRARAVWMRSAGEDDTLWWGAAIEDDDAEWRALVDAALGAAGAS